MAQTDIPSLPIDEELNDSSRDADLIPPDTRRHRRLLDSRVQKDGELSDSDDEGEGGRRNHASNKEADEATGSKKFSLGVGIMGLSTGPSATHAGPSGHARALSGTLPVLNDSMDVDEQVPRGELVNGSSKMTEVAAGTPSNGIAEVKDEGAPMDGIEGSVVGA
jgi:histone deacetylase 1/2